MPVRNSNKGRNLARLEKYFTPKHVINDTRSQANVTKRANPLHYRTMYVKKYASKKL